MFRLIDGSTNREGKVEVCVDGRWGTVCNNSQERIAGAVCSQLGFPAEGSYCTCIHVACVASIVHTNGVLLRES